MASSISIGQSIRAKLQELEDEYAAKKAAIDAEYAPALKRLRDTLSHWQVPDAADLAPNTALSIGDDRLAAIRQFVLEHADIDGVVRQADITDMLLVRFGISSSSASAAASTGVRRLWSEKLIEPAPKVRGSNAWRLTQIQSLAA